MVSRGGTYSTRETAGIGAGAEVGVGVRAVIEVGAGARTGANVCLEPETEMSKMGGYSSPAFLNIPC